jgi:hypothetical protein
MRLLRHGIITMSKALGASNLMTSNGKKQMLQHLAKDPLSF